MCPILETLFFRLSKVIDFDNKKKRIIIKRLKKRKRWEPIIISDNLSWSEFSRLNLFLHEMQGVKPVVALARKYTSRWFFFAYYWLCFRYERKRFRK